MPDLSIETFSYKDKVVSIKYSLTGNKESKFDTDIYPYQIGKSKPLGELTFKDLDGYLAVNVCDQTDFCVSAYIEDSYARSFNDQFCYLFEFDHRLEDFQNTNEMIVNSLTINYVLNYIDIHDMNYLQNVSFLDKPIFAESNLTEKGLKKYIETNLKTLRQ